MILEATKFLSIQHNEHSQTVEIKWFPETSEMTDGEYKEILDSLASLVENHRIVKWLGDTRSFAFTIAPHLQEWTALNFNSRLLKSGLKKMALIIPEEFISNLAVQQTVEEMEALGKENQFVTRYFDNLTDAKKWLDE